MVALVRACTGGQGGVSLQREMVIACTRFIELEY